MSIKPLFKAHATATGGRARAAPDDGTVSVTWSHRAARRRRLGPAVKPHVAGNSLPQAELQALTDEAHETICSCSHAMRNNGGCCSDGRGRLIERRPSGAAIASVKPIAARACIARRQAPGRSTG